MSEPIIPTDPPEECESCGYATYLSAYEMRRGFPSTIEYKWLCGLCAGTTAGTAYEYPDQFKDAYILSTVCYVGNAILDAIRKRG